MKNQADVAPKLSLSIKRIRTRVATSVKTGGVGAGSCGRLTDPTDTLGWANKCGGNPNV